jgi:hypothetical protein
MDNVYFLNALASGLGEDFDIIYCSTQECGMSGPISIDVIFRKLLYVCSISLTGVRVEVSFASYCVHEDVVAEDIADPAFDPFDIIEKVRTALSEKALRKMSGQT